MGSRYSESGVLGWEGAVVVDGVNNEEGKDFIGVKQGGPRAGCKGELVRWGAQLWLPLSAPCSMRTHFLLHCLTSVNNRVVFAF